MEIKSIRHKALRRYFEEGLTKGLDGNLVERLRKMLAFIDAAEAFGELATPLNYGLHALTGNRSGSWAMTLTRNWRPTFDRLDDDVLAELDLEDYH